MESSAGPTIPQARKRRLPHWEAGRATYFVTFRLADSLPQKVLNTFRFERQDILATAKRINRQLSLRERARLKRLFSEQIERHLDAGVGARLLGKPGAAAIVADALQHFDGNRYDLFSWCVMPNHVHVVLRPCAGHHLAGILHSWKSFTATRINRLLDRAGRLWQREYYDHLIRDEREFGRIIDYVLQNPAKAGLTRWPWVGMRGNRKSQAGRDRS